ncbi:MAG: TetR/AcrR family transcriptional regulator [Lachnotalea sp.]
MATDARIRYTKMVIQNAFIQLLNEKPINKITVMEVCRIAEINRATFYKYYSDPYDWLEKMEKTIINNAKEIIRKINVTNSHDTFTQFLGNIANKKEFLSVLAAKYGDKIFYEELFSICLKEIAVQNQINALFSFDKHSKWKEYFLAYGCSGIVRCWIENEMKEEPSEVAQYITDLIKNVLI